MPLLKSLEKWDGRQTALLEKIYQTEDDLIKKLLCLLNKGDKVQIAATWLLKKHLEEQGSITKKQILQIYQQIDIFTSWQSKLHILQSMPYMAIPKTVKPKIAQFLHQHLTDTNKLIRAWSYNGLFLLSQQYPEYQKDVNAMLDMALRDEAASVKARIRNIRKESGS